MAPGSGGLGVGSSEVESVMFAYREMQLIGNKEFFQLEIASQSHTHRTLNELLKFAMGKPCQKT